MAFPLVLKAPPLAGMLQAVDRFLLACTFSRASTRKRPPSRRLELMTGGSRSCISKVEVLKMRSPLPFTFLLAVTITAGAAQQAGRHGAPRFDPPTVTTATEAVYPLQSVASGTVVLEVTLDNGGKIAGVRGIPSLTESAEQAVQGWKFQPARLNGKPVPSTVPVAFSFVPPNVGPRG